MQLPSLISRRALLAVGTTAVTAAVAGCSEDILDDTSSAPGTTDTSRPDSDPSEAAFAAYVAIGDAETLADLSDEDAELYHPESAARRELDTGDGSTPLPTQVPISHETVTVEDDATNLDADLPDGTLPDSSDPIAGAIVRIEVERAGRVQEVQILMLAHDGSWTVFTPLDSESLSDRIPLESGRYLALRTSDTSDGELAFESADSEPLLHKDDGTPVIVYTYNRNARMRITEAVSIVNDGDEPLTSLQPTISVSGTSSDGSHAEVFSITVDETPADGDDLLSLTDRDTLAPGESISVGLEIDLIDGPIEELEIGANKELIFSAST